MHIAFEVAARHLIAAALILGFGLLALGCGDGGGDRSAEAVEWGVARQVGPRQVKLVTSVDYCGGEAPTLERPVIEYSGRRVFIELLLTPEDDSDDRSCILGILGLTKTVTLKRDLDELVLFDSSADPPERRWPTR